MVGLIGKKIGMTRTFGESGESIPVTVVEAGPCYVSQIKTTETDGYSAVQLGYKEKKESKTPKPQIGHFTKANVKPMYHLKEFRNFNLDKDINIGDKVEVDVFAPGDVVFVTGKSKGKGFQGVMKRYDFSGGPKTHGQSDRLRAPGSIGQSSSPSRVMKGIGMPGRMGNKQVTTKNLRIVKVVPEQNVIFIHGAVPGSINSIIEIKKK